MSYSLRLVTGPGVEPVTAAELAAHARATGASDQALIANYVTPAREAIERACRVAMINQNWEYWLDRLPDPEPAGRIIELPIGPLSSVTSVTVYDPFDAPTLIQPSAYLVDTASDPGRLILRPDAGINRVCHQPRSPPTRPLPAQRARLRTARRHPSARSPPTSVARSGTDAPRSRQAHRR